MKILKTSLDNMKSKLRKSELRNISGGSLTPGVCCCMCQYAGQGGSSSGDNDGANNKGGLHSPPCTWDS